MASSTAVFAHGGGGHSGGSHCGSAHCGSGSTCGPRRLQLWGLAAVDSAGADTTAAATAVTANAAVDIAAATAPVLPPWHGPGNPGHGPVLPPNGSPRSVPDQWPAADLSSAGHAPAGWLPAAAESPGAKASLA